MESRFPAPEPQNSQEFQHQEYSEYQPVGDLAGQGEDHQPTEIFTADVAVADEPDAPSTQLAIDPVPHMEPPVAEALAPEQEAEIAAPEVLQATVPPVAIAEFEPLVAANVDASADAQPEAVEVHCAELSEPAQVHSHTPDPQDQVTELEDDFEINFAVELPAEEAVEEFDPVQVSQPTSAEIDVAASSLEQFDAVPEQDQTAEDATAAEVSQGSQPPAEPDLCAETDGDIDCQPQHAEQPIDQPQPPPEIVGTVFEIDDDEAEDESPSEIDPDVTVDLIGQEPADLEEVEELAPADDEPLEVADSTSALAPTQADAPHEPGEIDADSAETHNADQPEIASNDLAESESPDTPAHTETETDGLEAQPNADPVIEEEIPELGSAQAELETDLSDEVGKAEQAVVSESEIELVEPQIAEDSNIAAEVASAVEEDTQPAGNADISDADRFNAELNSNPSSEAVEQQDVEDTPVAEDETHDGALTSDTDKESGEVTRQPETGAAQEFSQIMESLSEKFSPQASDADAETVEHKPCDNSAATDNGDLEVEFDESATDPEAGETARMLLDIMSKPSGASQPQERALAADTLLRLVTKIPVINLISLSDRICIMESPPALLVNKLIRHPDARVAGPLLETCAAISDQVLLPVIGKADNEKRRMIARRNSLSPALCDALLERGDSSVFLTVVRNPGASLSHDAFITLSEQARSQPSLQAPLVTRGDTPAPIAFELFWFLPSELRRYVLSRFLTDSETLNKILKIALAVDSGTGAAGDPETRFAESHRAAELCTLIEEGSSNRAAALLSELAGINEANALRIISDPDGDPLTVAMKSLGVMRAVFSDALKCWQGSPNCLIRAERPAVELQNLFDSLSFNKARVLLTYWDWAALESGPYARKAA